MEKKITIRFKADEFEWVRAQAESQGWSYADYIRLKIREYHPVTGI
jgi:predicted DNA binding CopG/RHH family protein